MKTWKSKTTKQLHVKNKIKTSATVSNVPTPSLPAQIDRQTNKTQETLAKEH